jgi:hypothetical protein
MASRPSRRSTPKPTRCRHHRPEPCRRTRPAEVVDGRDEAAREIVELQHRQRGLAADQIGQHRRRIARRDRLRIGGRFDRVLDRRLRCRRRGRPGGLRRRRGMAA